jgi:hypothetical protein
MSCACKRTFGVSREMAGVFSLTVFVRYTEVPAKPPISTSMATGETTTIGDAIIGTWNGAVTLRPYIFFAALLRNCLLHQINPPRILERVLVSVILHSQRRSTLHPSNRSSLDTRRSLARFDSSFPLQNSEFLEGDR